MVVVPILSWKFRFITEVTKKKNINKKDADLNFR